MFLLKKFLYYDRLYGFLFIILFIIMVYLISFQRLIFEKPFKNGHAWSFLEDIFVLFLVAIPAAIEKFLSLCVEFDLPLQEPRKTYSIEDHEQLNFSNVLWGWRFLFEIKVLICNHFYCSERSHDRLSWNASTRKMASFKRLSCES